MASVLGRARACLASGQRLCWKWCKVTCMIWSADRSHDVRQDPSVTAALDEAVLLMDELDALTM